MGFVGLDNRSSTSRAHSNRWVHLLEAVEACGLALGLHAAQDCGPHRLVLAQRLHLLREAPARKHSHCIWENGRRRSPLINTRFCRYTFCICIRSWSQNCNGRTGMQRVQGHLEAAHGSRWSGSGTTTATSWWRRLSPNTKDCATNGDRTYTFSIFSGATYSPAGRTLSEIQIGC